MKKFYTIFAIVFLITILFCVFGVEIAQASQFSGGLQNTAGNVPNLGKATPQSFAATLIKSLIIFVGVIFMIVFIYGGTLYMFSQGDPKKVQKAKGLLITAIIGLAIVLMAYTIAYFVSSTIEQSFISQ